MRMYYGCSIGKAKKKYLRSHDMNSDPFFSSDMVLFKRNFVSMKETAGDTVSSG